MALASTANETSLPCKLGCRALTAKLRNLEALVHGRLSNINSIKLTFFRSQTQSIRPQSLRIDKDGDMCSCVKCSAMSVRTWSLVRQLHAELSEWKGECEGEGSAPPRIPQTTTARRAHENGHAKRRSKCPALTERLEKPSSSRQRRACQHPTHRDHVLQKQGGQHAPAEPEEKDKSWPDIYIWVAPCTSSKVAVSTNT